MAAALVRKIVNSLFPLLLLASTIEEKMPFQSYTRLYAILPDSSRSLLQTLAFYVYEQIHQGGRTGEAGRPHQYLNNLKE